jgi:AmmeMemoRadiSam system protein A
MSEDRLSPEAKATLLKLARSTLKQHFKREADPVDTSLAELQRNRGAFVSLHKKGALRGCIGVFSGKGPLHATVSSMALSAAFEDPRFPPLTAKELDDVEIEISVLSPLKRIESVEEIEVGKHGIYLVKGFNRGVLLPQVATEYGWDRKTFLDQTCLKAGLPGDCWREGAEIYTFTAEVFGEEEKHSLSSG